MRRAAFALTGFRDLKAFIEEISMNSRVTAILVIALLISGGATYLVYRVVTARAAQGPAQASTQVVMAARDLEIGTLIKDADVTTGPWTGPLPKGLVTKKEAVKDRGVVAPIYQGEPLMENRLAPPGAGGGLAATIPPGMRAVAVRVDDIVGVAGFVVPGMRVDILISGVPPGTQTQSGAKVKTILQNIEVLSAGQNYQKDAEGKPVVVQVLNLLVTPEQAEILSLASSQARIQLVLRNRLDTQQTKTPGTAVATLFGEPAKPAPAAARTRVVAAQKKAPIAEKPLPPPTIIIEVINGPQRTEAKFVRRLEEKQ
jgi:pilus assembly protein CpaB